MTLFHSILHVAGRFRDCLILVGVLVFWQTPATAADGAKAIRSPEMDQILLSAGFNGVALLRAGGTTVHWQAYGSAVIDPIQPNTPETSFRIASVSKAFASTLTLMLADQGVLDLHRPITDYLPTFRSKSAPLITLHHLLAHTSGIPHFVEIPGWLSGYAEQQLARQQMLDLIATQPLVAPVGQSRHYSSANYYLVAAILESQTGQLYSDLMDTQILKPFGLENTGVFRQGLTVAGLAQPYDRAGANVLGSGLNMALFMGSGSMHATAPDLASFSEALMRGGLLSHEALQKMLGHYGWSKGRIPLSASQTSPVVFIEGQLEGYVALLAYFPECKATLVLLNNTSMTAQELSGLAVALAVASFSN